MMGKKALDAARILVEDAGLQGRLTPEEFLREREAKLDLLFPTAELMPGASELPCLCAPMLALWSARPSFGFGSRPCSSELQMQTEPVHTCRVRTPMCAITLLPLLHTCWQRFLLGRAGAERLLRHLHAHGVPFALATSSHQRHYAVKTQRHTDLFALFSHRVTGV